MANNKDKKRPTDRFEAKRQTKRFTEGKVTDDFSRFGLGRDELMASLNLRKGDLVDDRFCIEEGPIGGDTGEAEIFKCKDENTGLSIALKMYRFKIMPKQSVLEQFLLLNHPDIVSLKAYGRWMDRFYEAMEFCTGGSLAEHMPFSESEINGFLGEIVNGLNYCHAQGVIHRDIKPSNFFFRKQGKQDIVIADFGISSILEDNEKVRKTHTFHLTIDYAAPELIFNKMVSPKTDYYALGITLLHLLTGRSPFNDMEPLAISMAHGSRNIPLPAGMSSDFTALIKGLTQFSPESRWGYRQVMCWLKGEAVLSDDGTSWREDAYSGKERSYPGYSQAKTPAQLAASLDKFNAGKQLFEGDISRWIFDHFDSELAEKIRDVEENYTDRPQLGVFKLRYVLDPFLPLVISDRPIKTITELVELLKTKDSKILQELENALWGEFIESWIELAEVVPDSSRRSELSGKIRSIRERLRNRRLALTSFLYTLDPTLPFEIEDGLSISTPNGIEDAIKKAPAIAERLKDILFDGRLEEWLRAVFPDSNDDISFIESCRSRFSSDKDLGIYSLRWYFCPTLPFPFGNEKVTLPAQLAKLIDKDNASKSRGIQIMSNGWLRTWLTVTGKMTDPKTFDEELGKNNYSKERKLEAILHILDPKLPWPKPTPDKKLIKIGRVAYDTTKTASITISNAGRGFLSGGISLSGSSGGFAINQYDIEGGPVTVHVAVRPLGLPAGSRQSTKLMVQTNGGTIEIPVSYIVAAPIWKMIGRSILAGILFGGALGLLRFLLNEMSSLYRDHTMDWINWNSVNGAGGKVFLFLLFGVSFICIVGGSVYYLHGVIKGKHKS